MSSGKAINGILLISMVKKKPETSTRIGYGASSFSRDENSHKMHPNKCSNFSFTFSIQTIKTKEKLGLIALLSLFDDTIVLTLDVSTNNWKLNA